MVNMKNRKLSVAEKHQLKVARQVVKMPDAAIPFSGFKGTRKDAEQTIARLTGKRTTATSSRIKPVANSKDILYFKSHSDAEKVAKANNWKTPIVRYFDKGYAIQRNVSGAYFGAHNDDATKAVTKNALDKAIAKQNKIDEKRAAKGLVARSRRYVFGK